MSRYYTNELLDAQNMVQELVEALDWAIRQIDMSTAETDACYKRYDQCCELLERAREE